MEEVLEVPPALLALPLGVADLLDVGLAEELHPHHGEDEDDDHQDDDEVPQCAHRLDHDLKGVVERLPRLGKLRDNP